MKLFRNIGLSFLMQIIILIMHIFINNFHSNDCSFEEKFQVICSILSVVAVTCLVFLVFKLPIYTIATAQIITFLYILFFELPGVYLLYYLHKGKSPFFNPDVFTDSTIITIEMFIVQILSIFFVRLIQYIYHRLNRHKKRLL